MHLLIRTKAAPLPNHFDTIYANRIQRRFQMLIGNTKESHIARDSKMRPTTERVRKRQTSAAMISATGADLIDLKPVPAQTLVPCGSRARTEAARNGPVR